MSTATSTEHGNGDVARGGEILRTVVGSGVHGIAIPGTDDHDEMGVFVEPAERVLGLAPAAPHYVWRTQPEGARSGPGDVDLVMYSLGKYLRLATKGNPTALLPLYAATYRTGRSWWSATATTSSTPRTRCDWRSRAWRSSATAG